MKSGKIFVISGPAGVGKGSVLKKLLEKRKDIYVSVSATTRPPRAGEEDGVHYRFLSADTFHEWIAQDAFLEYAEYVGNYYGTPRRFVDEALESGRDVILEIDVHGAAQIIRKRPDAILIFIAPPSWEELERRLVSRGTESLEKIQKRLLQARVECKTAGTGAYHYFVINDTIEAAAMELDAIMTAEHCRSIDRMEIISGK